MLSDVSVHDFTVWDFTKSEISMKEFAGKVLLIVNVASKCSLASGSYKNLKELAEAFPREDLQILLFPCKQFFNQEFKEIKEVEEFVKKQSSQFVLMDFVNVKGEDAHPLYKFLSKSLPGTLTNSVKWNFTYFLVDRSGRPRKRYGPTDSLSSTDPVLLECIENGTRNL